MKKFLRGPETTLLLLLVVLTALPAGAEERLRMSTTTSTENSGLLSVLLPPFEKKFDCKVDVVAVGTGKSLKLGEAGGRPDSIDGNPGRRRLVPLDMG